MVLAYFMMSSISKMDESLMVFRPCMLWTQQSLEFISTFLYDFPRHNHDIYTLISSWSNLYSFNNKEFAQVSSSSENWLVGRWFLGYVIRQNVIHLLLWGRCHVHLCGPVWAVHPTWNITQTNHYKTPIRFIYSHNLIVDVNEQSCRCALMT